MSHLLLRWNKAAFGFAVLSLCSSTAWAQTGKTLSPQNSRPAIGSAPVNPGPLAHDLSPELRPDAIQRAMRKVADWQLIQARGKYNQEWTYAPLYLGLLATSATTGDPRYRDAVLKAARSFDWKLLANQPFNADATALGQVYEALYRAERVPIRISDTKAIMDELVLRPDSPNKDLWWWCDALFMAPATLAGMSVITADPSYDRKMDAEWRLTQEHLYDPAEHLFFRDATYLHAKEKNGKPLFWSRGNGWVMAGAVDVLRVLPKTDPARSRYITLLRQMAHRVAELQQPDGLWRPGLLNPAAYPLPEISGSAFFTYAITWGIRHGYLPRATYEPVVQRAWAGMLRHVYADGRLGAIQPVGAAPDAFAPSSSYVYGVGAFLLAGAELDRLVEKR